jgi:hypothetical protein
MSDMTDIRRTMARAVRDEAARAERQLKAISRSANVDLDRFEKPVGETQPSRTPASKRKS